MQCSGKVVLVTGAQQGIGRAMAIEFAAVGADIAINWLDDERAAEGVADHVRSHGRRTLTVKADVADIEQAQAMVAGRERAFSGCERSASRQPRWAERPKKLPPACG
jgi:NAD(P)-dependent dehydrogenase (short-subunit alcohol dehydrogenase family)